MELGSEFERRRAAQTQALDAEAEARGLRERERERLRAESRRQDDEAARWATRIAEALSANDVPQTVTRIGYDTTYERHGLFGRKVRPTSVRVERPAGWSVVERTFPAVSYSGDSSRTFTGRERVILRPDGTLEAEGGRGHGQRLPSDSPTLPFRWPTSFGRDVVMDGLARLAAEHGL